MNYTQSKLYAVKTLDELYSILKIDKNTIPNFTVFTRIEDSNRLIESPCDYIIIVQRKVKPMLEELTFPSYYYSIKGHSYIDNSRCHSGNSYLLKNDISAFFPSVSSIRVFNFFHKKLHQSIEVANYMTKLTTYDLRKSIKFNSFKKYFKLKKFAKLSHLITGGPISNLLSFCVNKEMFDELYTIAQNNNLLFSVYVDDFIFSSKNPFDHKIISSQSKRILAKYGYGLNSSKSKYNRGYSMEVTGTVISKNSICIPNRLQKDIHILLRKYKRKNISVEEKEVLKGKIQAARQIIPNYLSGLF